MSKEQKKKLLAYVVIILTGIAASLALGIPAKRFGKGEFWEKFCIIVPSAWVGYAICRYRNNEKL